PDVDPHDPHPGVEERVAGEPQAADIIMCTEPLVSDVDVDVPEIDDVADVGRGAIECLLGAGHSSSPAFGSLRPSIAQPGAAVKYVCAPKSVSPGRARRAMVDPAGRVRRSKGQWGERTMKTILIPTEDHDAMPAVLEAARIVARTFDSYIE